MKKGKISKLRKKWIARKLLGYIVGLIIVGIAIWGIIKWVIENPKEWSGGLWFLVFFIGMSILIYFWEEKFSEYKRKRGC